MKVTAADPVADGPGISRVDGWQDLAQEFSEGFEALVGPMVDWMMRHRLRQEKTLWAAAADRLAQSLVWCGRAFDEQDFALELAHELLDRPGPMKIPLETGVDGRGEEQHLRTDLLPGLPRGRWRALLRLPAQPLTAAGRETSGFRRPSRPASLTVFMFLVVPTPRSNLSFDWPRPSG